MVKIDIELDDEMRSRIELIKEAFKGQIESLDDTVAIKIALAYAENELRQFKKMMLDSVMNMERAEGNEVK